MDEKNNTAELQHHGIKGQKWGVRRTPAQLGHEPTGKKKKKKAKSPDLIDKAKAKIASVKKEREKKEQDKAKAKEAEKKAQEAEKKKSAKDMSDDELRKAIVRAQMEDQYRQLRPDDTERAADMVKTVAGKVIAPAAMNAGRKFLEDGMNKLGAKVTDKALEKAFETEFDKLKKEEDLLNLKDRLKKLKNPNTDEYDKLKKEYDLLDIKNKIENLKNPKTNWEDKKKESEFLRDEYSHKLTAEKNKKEYQEYMRKERTKKWKPKVETNSVKEEIETVVGEVVGNAFKSNKQNDTSTHTPDPIIIDMDTTDVVSTSAYSSGRSYYNDTFSGSSTASKPPSAVNSLVSLGSSWLREQLIED